MTSTSGRFSIPPLVFEDAVRYFWVQRDRQAAAARAGEGQGRNVRGGMHLDGVQSAIVTLMLEHGVSPSDIYANCALHKTGKLELPGYFRPTKQWDLLVVRDGRLLAAMELKAQVGPSFGNNFNNRTEEAIGSSQDLWTAYRENAFGQSPQPWLGYLFLLEDHQRSTSPVRSPEPHFEVFSEFRGASYARRYELFCRKLVLERKYSSACFLMSRRPQLESTQYEGPRVGRRDDHPSMLSPAVEHANDSLVYIETSGDLGAHQFLSSLLRYVVPD